MILFLLSMVLSGASAQADSQGVDASLAEDRRQISISSSGDAMGSCDAYTFQFCSSNLSRNAEMYAEQDAERTCSSHKGTLVSRPYCSTFCNPSFPPAVPVGAVFTSCSAHCTATCEIED